MTGYSDYCEKKKVSVDIKAKLAKRVFRDVMDILSDEIKETLNNGSYIIIITKKDKFTIAEIIINFDNYNHHYFGLSAKHPKDEDNYSGEINAIKDALRKMKLSSIGKTQVNKGNFTCICVEPLEEVITDKLFGHLNLL